jgi:hypothetical protein
MVAIVTRRLSVSLCGFSLRRASFIDAACWRSTHRNGIIVLHALWYTPDIIGIIIAACINSELLSV